MVQARPLLLHVFHGFGIGGQEVRAAQLMNRLAGRYQHRILALNGVSAATGRLSKDVDYEILPAPSLAGPLPRRLLGLARWLKAQAPDLLLTYNWGTMDFAAANAFLARLPHIHHEDGFGIDEARRQHRRRIWFRRLVLPRADAVVVPSRTLELAALDIWRLPPSLVHYIPNGVEIDAFLPPRPDAIPGLVKQEGDIVVGTLASLRREKNLPRLVRAFAAAFATTAAAKLVIAGEGDERDAIRAQAKALGIEHRVLLSGYLARPADFVGLFDIFALSSDTEQFPISLVEAMAAGCAVASTKVGDVADILPESQAPYIVAPDDEAGLAEALQRLAADGDLRRRLGAENRGKVERTYDLSRMVARHDALYRQALAR